MIFIYRRTKYSAIWPCSQSILFEFWSRPDGQKCTSCLNKNCQLFYPNLIYLRYSLMTQQKLNIFLFILMYRAFIIVLFCSVTLMEAWVTTFPFLMIIQSQCALWRESPTSAQMTFQATTCTSQLQKPACSSPQKTYTGVHCRYS